MSGIFGHGNVIGLGQALEEHGSELPFHQGRNEQSMAHAAAAFAKPRASAASGSLLRAGNCGAGVPPAPVQPRRPHHNKGAKIVNRKKH